MGFRLSNNRYEEIKKIVVNTFVKQDIKCVPINGFEIAAKLGVTAIPYSSLTKKARMLLLELSKDGVSIEKEDDEWCIYYNDKLVYGRVNYTLMHEIGHIILNHSQESDLADAEANFFAKYALAPPVLIHELGLKSPGEISNKFDVSYQEACYAYSYYQMWLQYGEDDYTDYELRTISLFEDAM